MLDIEFLLEQSNRKPTDPPPSTISEYMQGRRIFPPGSPRPGIIDLHIAPAMIEPMDCMSPLSGVNHVTMMKAVQIFCTTYLAEHVIAYFMDASPAEIIYLTATIELLSRWTKRLEPLIDSCGYRDKIVAQTENDKSRKTGDKTFSKEYPGGSLSMASLQAPAGMRSESKQILIVDEADAAPAKTTTGEGNFLGILRGRTAAYGARYKIMELSTPATLENSVIFPQFESGDQRYYNMPCPRCGVLIVFKFDQLRPEFDQDRMLQYVWYECQECKGIIHQKEKTKMMDDGMWIPTAIPKERNHRSYQINSLYSPVGFCSWERVYSEYLKSEEDAGLKPSFTNLYLGLPYKEDGHRPDINKIISLRGNYKNGTVPHGVLYMTMAADVQRGMVKYQNMTPGELSATIEQMKKEGVNLWKAELPRVEMEVYGVGMAYRSWSVDYKVFYGHTTHSGYDGAFEEFYLWAENGGMEYHRSDGVLFLPQMVFVDSADGVTQAAVYEFCDRFGPNTYPIIGEGWLKKKKDPGIDEETQRNFDRYRIVIKKNSGGNYVQISTNYYKKIVYRRLNIQREIDESKPQRPAFCEFPRDRPDHYFKMLTNEEMLTNGSFDNGRRPVESLDCRGYNLCAADVWVESAVRKMQDKAKTAGFSEIDIKKHDKKYFLSKLENKINKS